MLFSKISISASLAVAFLGSPSLVSATTLHWNKGCGLVDGEAICASINQIELDNGSAQIFACFSGSDSDESAYAACGMVFSWPSYYGDVYYGADNCLYDARGLSIEGQCNINGQGGATVLNPYYVYYG